MSKIEVDTIEPQSGTSLTLGASGDTITIPSGATLTNSGTATGFGGGKVLQVIQATTTSSTSFTTTSFVAATGLSVSITPSSASNKIYVISSTTGEMSSGGRSFLTIFRDSTNVVADGLVTNQVGGLQNPITLQFLDSPSTTSAVSYSVRGRVQTGGQTLSLGSGTMVIIVMEIQG